MQTLPILSYFFLKRGDKYPGKKAVKLYPAPHRDLTPFLVCWVSHASAQGDASGRWRLGTKVLGM
jgi:hypothetical protein